MINLDNYTGPTMDQILAMQHDGIKHNYANALAAYNAAQNSQRIPTVIPPTPVPVDTSIPTSAPTPAPAPVGDPAPTGPTKDDFMKQVNQAFTPGFEYNAVPSSLLDDTINSILNQQKGQAQDYLDRGLKRGIYNDVGYNAGLSALNRDAALGKSDLSSLGSSVIDKYRTNVDNIRDNAYSAASGYTPGMTFSLDPYVNEFKDTLARAQTNAGGDLQSLLGGRNYFDFSGLNNQAGQAQGATNLRDSSLFDALANRKRQNSQDRGLGSQGAF